MHRRSGSTGAKGALALVLCAILFAGITGLPAGSGNLGRQRDICCSQVDVVIGTTTFTETIVPSDTTISLRNRLVAQIDFDPNFSATEIYNPFEAGEIGFQVLTQGGAEIGNLSVCENGVNLQTLGTDFPMGKDRAIIRKATSITGVNSDPNLGAPVYALTVRTWEHPVHVRTYNTSLTPNNTATGLNNSVRVDLITAGFTVQDDGTSFTIQMPNDMIVSVRNFSSDSGFTQFCASLQPTPAGGGVPTLSQTGMFLLVLMLTAAATLILRRKSGTMGGAAG